LVLRAKQSRYRPAPTRSSWVNIKTGWYQSILLDRYADTGQHDADSGTVNHRRRIVRRRPIDDGRFGIITATPAMIAITIVIVTFAAAAVVTMVIPMPLRRGRRGECA
jgi:hypothetical protein